jgi:hypothetical protein
MKKTGEKTKKSTHIKDIGDVDADVKNMMSVIHKWQIEAYSPYNDGWTQLHYREKIRQIKEILGVYEEPIRLVT